MTPATDGPQHLRNRLSPFREPEIVNLPDTPRRPDTWLTARSAIFALLALGLVLRVVPQVQNRNLWIDEARLALNLVERPPAGLLEPLGWNQGAPVGFLLAVKAAISIFGASEWALRLVPFASSIVGMVGFAWVARRSLPASAAIIATALFAISPLLISYSAECKQYATDAALAIGALTASLGLLYREGSAKDWSILAAFGAIAVWFSHPIVFVLASVGTALFIDSLLMRDRRRSWACVATIGCWLVSFAVCYVTMLRHLGMNRYLIDYWAGHFMALPPKSVGDIAWLVGHLSSFVDSPGGLGGTELKAGGLASAFFLIGIAAFVRERWTVAFVLVAPAGFALLASAFQKYPFAERMLLFLVPLLLLGVARGAWAVGQALRANLPFANTILVGILVLAPAVQTIQQFRHPLRCEQLVPLLDDVRSEWLPGDKVYLYWGAIPAYEFYTREKPFVPGMVLKGTEFHDPHQTDYRDELRLFAGEPRVWLVFSHRHQSEELVVKTYAEGLGECRREIHEPGANAFLFDFSRAR